ncbi:uncharacterized protein HD556DRAFT_1306913 [Suillus plorans]|uniref:Uncharacterized protein n=1 Tax=Suillus plorans TaxID=116603 RepID=A0A9P7ATY7_9AGAM|nr:uncharacterized protein HD556DRAFT_1306913 [Suillus plorans]KAG1796732.1 hypothetical protein HD556DRAFT_1306913 [Suillus plorans]
MASLSKEQLKEAQNTADFVKKKAPGMMKDLANKLWKQAGIRIFILSAWKTEEGEVRINVYKGLQAQWNAYAGEEFNVDLNNDDNNNEWEVKKSRKKGGKKDNYPLEVDSYGLPVIPDIEDLSLENSRMSSSSDEAQGILRQAWLLTVFRCVNNDKTMKEPVDTISGDNSDTRPRVPVKKSTRKPCRRVRQESSGEDECDDDDEGEKDKEHKEEDEKGNEEHIVCSPPSKSKPSKKQDRASTVQSELQQEDPRPPVKNSMLVASPLLKSKSTKKWSEDNTGTSSAQSTGNHLGDTVLPSHHVSKNRAFGPTSGVHTTYPSKGHWQENQRT